ncbi:TipC family immunity protein [Streptococcus oricebi]|uniref:TipC family immunity protein n=1 Tax=Streptococcus oricebi TaxID=1547447 RepID=A0ABS5B1F5_9STRE|nr:TipC family immunity protein [Streptococcus oricebi]MBP2622331.1 hypothetical protein [Streptococcus oricebi]
MSKRKIIVVVTGFLLVLLSVFFWFSMTRPKNIFEEIYYQEKETYLSQNPILNKIKGVIAGSYKDTSDLYKNNPVVRYQNASLPKGVYDTNYNFSLDKKFYIINFEKIISDDIGILFYNTYSLQDKALTRKIQIVIGKRENTTRNYIDSNQEIQKYLSDYHISKDDLESYYNEIMNKLVLKDWISVYDSRFSPTNYGDVKVVTEW